MMGFFGEWGQGCSQSPAQPAAKPDTPGFRPEVMCKSGGCADCVGNEADEGDVREHTGKPVQGTGPAQGAGSYLWS